MRALLPDTRGLPRAFAWMWIGTLVNRLGSFVVPFLAIYLTEELHLGVERASFVVALVGLGSVLSGPAGGAVADRVGRRFALGAACTLGAAAMLALGFAREVTAIGAAAFALGFFGELFRPALFAMVSDVVPPEDRARAFGLLHWAVNVGFSVAPILAGLIAATSFPLLFYGDAATTLVFGALVVAGVPETRPKPDDTKKRLSLWTPYMDPVFLAFLALSLLLAMVFFQGFVALPLHMRAHGLSPRAYGGLLAINGALIVVFQPYASAWLARLDRARVMAASALLNGIGWGMTELGGSSPAMYAAAIVVWTAGEIANAPITPTIVADLAPPELRGSYQGAFQITFGAAAFLAPLVGGVMLARLGSAALWGGCAAVGALAAAGFLVVVPLADKRRAR